MAGFIQSVASQVRCLAKAIMKPLTAALVVGLGDATQNAWCSNPLAMQLAKVSGSSYTHSLAWQEASSLVVMGCEGIHSPHHEPDEHT